MQPVPLLKWVSENNPSTDLSYGKGWWDCIEFFYRLEEVYRDTVDITVIATFVMNTPPPTEQLLMPVFRLHHPEADFILRLDFSTMIGPNWVASVERQRQNRTPLYGLIDEEKSLYPDSISGFEPSWVYPCYLHNPSRFTCELDNEWKLYTFLWVLTHPT